MKRLLFLLVSKSWVLVPTCLAAALIATAVWGADRISFEDLNVLVSTRMRSDYDDADLFFVLRKSDPCIKYKPGEERFILIFDGKKWVKPKKICVRLEDDQ